MKIQTATQDLAAFTAIKSVGAGAWVEENTAILVFHGVGNQRPLETLDTFARGLVNVYLNGAQHDRDSLILEHRVAVKSGADGKKWFDNFIRFKCKNRDFHIDVYEYFWAHHPEDQVSLNDLQKWVEHTAQGAKEFYDQKQFTEKHGDASVFVADGHFDAARYHRTMWIAVQVIPALTRMAAAILNTARRVPLIGGLALSWLDRLRETAVAQLANVAGDVVAYNTTDEKARLFEIRSRVLAGAVDALRYLIEPQKTASAAEKKRQYDNVIVAAHSLGTQISFDAINRLSHLISQGEIVGVDRNGILTGTSDAKKKSVAELMSGYATFGSPLDKIAFFFRDRSHKEAYLRRQILEHFHCFKEKDWGDRQDGEIELKDELNARFFHDIQWRNYFDCNDPISGRLDYYAKVENINCHFVERKPGETASAWAQLYPFTHSYYWSSEAMFADIVANLVHRGRPQTEDHGTPQASSAAAEEAA